MNEGFSIKTFKKLTTAQFTMFRTEDGKVEELSILEPLMKILRANYAFPQDGKDADWKLLLKFAAPAIFAGPPVVIGLVGHIYITIKRGFWPEPIDSMTFLIQILSSAVILTTIGYNWRNFAVNADRIKKFDFGIPKECRVFAKRLDFVVTLVYYGVRIIILLHFVIFRTDTFCTKSRLIEDEGYVCDVPFPLWYPVKMQTYFVKTSLILCSYILAVSYLPIMCMTSLMPFTSAVLLIYRLKELKKLIIQSTRQRGFKPLREQDLIFFIRYHEEISDCAQKMNADLRYNQLGFYIFLPILMSLYLYKLIQENDLSTLVIIIPWFSPAAILCFIGERLQDEGYSLYMSFNDIPWYIMDTKVKKTYLIFLGKLQCPIRLRLKGVADLNHVFLHELIKGTYTFLVYLINGK